MAALAPEPTTDEVGVLARLSSTITVEEVSGNRIALIRQNSRPGGSERIISLTSRAEDALLAFLLARKGITLAGS